MLWLILGIILLAIAISGGAIVHPIIFVLALVALWMFFTGWRGRSTIRGRPPTPVRSLMEVAEA
jgi:hypothetical protein